MTARALDEPRFTQEQCEALFAAVLVDDVIDAETSLPASIPLDYEQVHITESFRLCRQVWCDGIDRRSFAALTRKLQRDRALSLANARAFKHVRAKFKHLRFAFANFDARHDYPKWLHRMTIVMGQLQDAFRNGDSATAGRYAALLRLFLTRWPFHLVVTEINRFEPSTPASFRANILSQIAELRAVLAERTMTAKQFHEARKVISRQVALYDSLRTLYPSPCHIQMSRALSAINGLMGGMHDRLITERIEGTLDYHVDRFAFPSEIDARLRALVARYPVTR